MRGKSEQQATILSAVIPDQLVPPEHSIRQVKPTVDQALAELSPTFSQMAPWWGALLSFQNTCSKAACLLPSTPSAASTNSVSASSMICCSSGSWTWDLATELHRILGVDLTRVPGLDTLTIYTFFSEVGPDLSKFPSGHHFASWLGLSPDNRVSGGKVLSVRTRKVKSRVAGALRMAAFTLSRSHSALGDYYRRMRARLGAPKGVTAAAHKLARIIHHLLTPGQDYDESVFAQSEEQHRQRRARRLEREAVALGYSLVPREHALQPVS